MTAKQFELPVLTDHARQVCTALDGLGGAAMVGDIAGAGRTDAEAGGAVARCAELGLSIPAAVVKAADDLMLGEQRRAAANAALAPAPFEPDALLADEWEAQLSDHCDAVARFGPGRGPSVEAGAAVAALRGRLARAAAAALPALADQTESWLIDHYDTLANADQPTDRLSENEFRAGISRLFWRAARALRVAGGGMDREESNAVIWWHCHRWTPQLWAELVEATLPQMSTGRRGGEFVVGPAPMLRLAAQLGAETRLARSLDEAREECAALLAELDDARPPAHYSIIGASF